MRESLLRSFLHHLDPDGRVRILKSSKDPGLREYLSVVGLGGTCSMDLGNEVFICIDDYGGATKAVWLEELAHARQFLVKGSFDESSDQKERCDREIEVHECLLENAERLKLTSQEIASCEAHLRHYKEIQNAKRWRS